MSQSGSTISVFGNWLVATREALLTGPEELHNEVVRRTKVIGDMLSGRSTKRVVRGGRYIEDRIRLRNQGNYTSFRPGDEFDVSRRQTWVPAYWGWRHVRNGVPLNEHELDFNEGDELSMFKRFESMIMVDLKSDHFDGMEDDLWRVPDQALMESITNSDGYVFSIPAYITENVTNPTTTGYRPPGWGTGTLGGVNPTTYDRWRPQRETYNSAAIDDMNDGVFAMFDRLILKLQFKPIPQATSFEDTDELDRCNFLTNLDGSSMVSRLLRAGNSFTRNGMNDPNYEAWEYRGIPGKYIEALDTALLDEVGGAYTNQAYPTGKPRFFCANWKYMYCVYHPKHFQRVTQEDGGSKQPGTKVFIMDSSWQLICVSRQRQGIGCPA